MQRLYTREEYHAADRMDEEREAANRDHHAISLSAFRAKRKTISKTLELLEEVGYDSLFSFKYSRRPNTAALALADQMPEEEKSRRLTICRSGSAPFRSGGMRHTWA